MSKNNQEKVSMSAIQFGRLVTQDIVASMRAVAEDEPIRNDSSYALKILWQIYLAAADYFEHFEEAMALNDEEVEKLFNEYFPVFVAEYPKIMVLDA